MAFEFVVTDLAMGYNDRL